MRGAATRREIWLGMHIWTFRLGRLREGNDGSPTVYSNFLPGCCLSAALMFAEAIHREVPQRKGVRQLSFWQWLTQPKKFEAQDFVRYQFADERR